MSTRATYQIDFTTFYIHYDGYPEGAAKYFADALKYRETANERAPNATLADDFIRANNRAELTPGHDVHGDTEYQYTVSTGGDFRFGPYELHIKAYDAAIDIPFFSGTLQEFIDKYGKVREPKSVKMSYIETLRQARDASKECCDALVQITTNRIGPETDRTYLAKLMGEAMRLNTSLNIFLAAVEEEAKK